VLDQVDFTQTVMPHQDEAYNLARWVGRGDDRPQKGKPLAHRMDRDRSVRYEPQRAALWRSPQSIWFS
jgi:hypothetical protein